MRIVGVAPARLALVGVLIGGLAGCLGGGEPSESEMRKAVEAHTKRRLDAQGRPFGGFDVFRKQGCKDAKDQDGRYDCYYAATFAPQPGQPPLTVNGKGRFWRQDKGTGFEDLGAQPK